MKQIFRYLSTNKMDNLYQDTPTIPSSSSDSIDFNYSKVILTFGFSHNSSLQIDIETFDINSSECIIKVQESDTNSESKRILLKNQTVHPTPG